MRNQGALDNFVRIVQSQLAMLASENQMLDPGEELRISVQLTRKVGEVVVVGQEPDSSPKDPKLLMSIRELNLTVRATNALELKKIRIVEDLIKRTADELLEIPRFGVTCLEEVREKLKSIGLRLKNDPE